MKDEDPPWIVADSLWERIEPLLPEVERRSRYPGRKRLDDRKVLCGSLFVLHTRILREFLPKELGFGLGMTCWCRQAEWHEAGVWDRLHQVLLAELHAAGKLDWSRAVIDSSHVRALKGGPRTGPSPVDRVRTGSKHYVLTGGNRNDVTQLIGPFRCRERSATRAVAASFAGWQPGTEGSRPSDAGPRMPQPAGGNRTTE